MPAPVLSALPGGSGVRIELPPVALKDRTALAKLLARRLKISPRRASVLAAQPANLFYQVTIVTTPRAANKTAFSFSDLLIGDAFASEGRKRRTYNTRNRVTIVRTSPGTQADVSFKVGILVKGQKIPVYTKSSPTATIQM